MGKSNELILNSKILAACLNVKRIFIAQDSFLEKNGVSLAGADLQSAPRRQQICNLLFHINSVFVHWHKE